MPSSDILCIHYYYPPIRSGGVLRNYFFGQSFSRTFRNVFVISTSNVHVLEKEEVPMADNIEIVLAKSLDFRSFKTISGHKKKSAKESWLFQFFSKFQKTLPFHFFLGEGSLIYIYNAIRNGNAIIKKNNIKVIYSSFQPYADHLVAYFLKKRHPHIKWIADFRDLQIEPLYKNIYFKNWNKFIEKKLLLKADLITTISQSFADYLSIYNQTLSVPRGVVLRDKISDENEKFVIAYTGNLYKNFRDGLPFARALKIFDRKYPNAVQFIHAGRDGDIWREWFEKEGIKHLMEDVGFVTNSEALNIQSSANLLLLLTSSSDDFQGVFTGKVFEYLGAGVPILNLINGSEDPEFEGFFDELSAGKIVYNDDHHAINEFIEHLYLSKNGGEVDLEKLAREHSWDRRVEKTLRALDLENEHIETSFDPAE